MGNVLDVQGIALPLVALLKDALSISVRTCNRSGERSEVKKTSRRVRSRTRVRKWRRIEAGRYGRRPQLHEHMLVELCANCAAVS